MTYKYSMQERIEIIVDVVMLATSQDNI